MGRGHMQLFGEAVVLLNAWLFAYIGAFEYRLLEEVCVERNLLSAFPKAEVIMGAGR